MKRQCIFLSVWKSLLALNLLGQFTCSAATWNVPADFRTIQEAIISAAAGDTITVAAGTYHESLAWGGKDLTIQGAGADPDLNPSIIDPSGGGLGGRCLFTSGLTLATKISGFILQNGSGGGGGGMYNNASSPTLSDCMFRWNSATTLGGGIYNESSSPAFANCTFLQNSAGNAGGGMYNASSSPAFADCSFIQNSASFFGGGVYNADSSSAFADCAFIDNSAGSRGGGMCNEGDASNPTLTHCSFILNRALGASGDGLGGGMCNISGTPTITGCVFWSNAAPFGGGGMFNELSAPKITSCTFAQNSGDYGGGIYNVDSLPTVRNCILWGNVAWAGGGMFNQNSTPIVSHSDVQDLPNLTPDSDGNFAADPLFVDESNRDLHLLSGSPCQNAGDDTVVTSPPFLSVGGTIIDLDGNPRLSGSRVDLGAYEIQEILAVVANAGPDQTVDLNAACQATVTLDGGASTGSALTFTWSEGGSVIANGATPQIPLSAGSHEISLTVNDPQGQTSSDSLVVLVQDATPPVPDAENLPGVSRQCSAKITTFPTATDNCSGAIIGTTTDPRTYSVPGTYIVTWHYVDGNGNERTQPQQVVVLPDTTPPVPDLADLPIVSRQCSAKITSAPTATDNCGDAITGVTTDPLTYTVPGTHIVTWHYVDGNGNESTQPQQVVVLPDVTPPVPDLAKLPTDSDVCAVTITTAPTATDNCGDTITGVTTDSLTYRRPGIHIVTWTYRDANGNTTTQTQQVEVLPDTLPPVPNAASLPTISGHCSVTISTAPTATDNCVRTITGVTSDPLTYTVPGTYTVTWRYDDGNGNSVMQQQTVIVQALTAPALAYNGATSSTPGATVTLVATLSAGSGKKAEKLAGQIITFALGTTTASAVTDASGNARVTLTAPAVAGSYPLSARYAGVCPYAASTVSKTFTVRKK